jgi:hypothetical protein
MASDHLNKDLSPSAVKRSIVKGAAQHPLTVYPAAAACLGAGYAATMGAGPIALGVVAGGVVISVASALWGYLVNGQKHASVVVERYRKKLEAERIALMDKLKEELSDIGHKEGLKQLSLFRRKYDNFVDVLGQKFSTGELTYNRYLTIAEQVYLGGVDNLHQVAMAFKSISAIDESYIKQQLKTLSADNAQHQEKRTALEARLALRDTQHQRIASLLVENEKALTQLDEVSMRISNISTQPGLSQTDLEVAMQELQRLIQRTEHYSE